jgi:hypothetical protein
MSCDSTDLRAGLILQGPLFNEPVRIETLRQNNPDSWEFGHEKNLGYDLTSLDTNSGELRLIEVKGIAAETGSICLTPNEKRVAEDRRDCYWLYIVTKCKSGPVLQEPMRDPARFEWHEVKKVDHYYLSVDAMTQPMQLREQPPAYG